MCRQCNEAGKYETCQACRAQAGARAVSTATAAPTGQLPVFALFEQSIAIYKQNFVLLSVTMVIVFCAQLALQALFSMLHMALPADLMGGLLMTLLDVVAQVALAAALMSGTMRIGLALAAGQPAELDLLRKGVREVVPLLLQGLVLYLGFGAFALLAALPFVFGLIGFATDLSEALPLVAAVAIGNLLALLGLVYISLGVLFSPAVLVAEQRGPIASIVRAWQLSEGHRLPLFFASLLLLALIVAGALACLVGLVFTLGLAQVFYARLFLALRGESPTRPATTA